MIYNSGYIIIDMQGINRIETAEQHVEGLYDRLTPIYEAKVQKPLLLVNWMAHSAPVFAELTGRTTTQGVSAYNVEFNKRLLNVNENDVVIIRTA